MVSISPWMGCDEWDVMLVKPFTGHCTECTVPTAINCCDCWPGPHVTHRHHCHPTSYSRARLSYTEYLKKYISLFIWLLFLIFSFLSLYRVYFDLFDKLLGPARTKHNTHTRILVMVSQFKIRMNVTKQCDKALAWHVVVSQSPVSTWHVTVSRPCPLPAKCPTLYGGRSMPHRGDFMEGAGNQEQGELGELQLGRSRQS